MITEKSILKQSSLVNLKFYVFKIMQVLLISYFYIQHVFKHQNISLLTFCLRTDITTKNFNEAYLCGRFMY